jgi:uncharacterized membrane protein
MNHKKTSAYLLLSVIAFIVCPFLGIFSLHHAIKAKNWIKTNNGCQPESRQLQCKLQKTNRQHHIK